MKTSNSWSDLCWSSHYSATFCWESLHPAIHIRSSTPSKGTSKPWWCRFPLAEQCMSKIQMWSRISGKLGSVDVIREHCWESQNHVWWTRFKRHLKRRPCSLCHLSLFTTSQTFYPAVVTWFFFSSVRALTNSHLTLCVLLSPPQLFPVSHLLMHVKYYTPI